MNSPPVAFKEKNEPSFPSCAPFVQRNSNQLILLSFYRVFDFFLAEDRELTELLSKDTPYFIIK